MNTEQVSLIVPRGAATARAYVCIPVDESVASRSSVIATLMDIAGFADLPEGVDVSDFLLWSDTRPEEASSLSAEELSCALQIGDKLGDMHSEAWAQAMARKLETANWNDDDETETVQTLILSLNFNLQGLVFRKLGDGGNVVAKVISHWPPALRQVYFDALVDTGDVTICSELSSMHVQVILSHMSRTIQTSSGLRKLCVDASACNTSTAALLSRTLLHHSASLTDIAVPLLTCSATIDSLPAATTIFSLWRLSHLTSLKLQCTSPWITSDADAASTVHALASSITKLPNLASFSLHNMNVTSAQHSAAAAGSAANKRRRLCNAAGRNPVISLDPVVTALSTAPSLTALSFSHSISSACTSPFPCSGVRGAFSTLQQLSISIWSECELDKDVMGADRNVLPSEPLPMLTYLHFSCDPNTLQSIAEEIVVWGFVQQQKLREAFLHLPSLTKRTAKLIEQEFGKLNGLKDLGVGFGTYACSSRARVQTAMSGFAQLAALTSLRLDLNIDNSAADNNGDNGDEQVDEVSSFNMLMPLSALATLQDLSSHDLLVPLAGFTRLTHLDICVGTGNVSAGALALQLQHVTGLRSLRAHVLEEEPVVDIRGCLRHLVHLTHLELYLMLVDAELLERIGCCMKNMPGIRKVSLQTCGPGADVVGDWVTGLLAFPCRGEYELEVGIDDVEDGLLDAVRQELTSRGGIIDDGFEKLKF